MVEPAVVAQRRRTLSTRDGRSPQRRRGADRRRGGHQIVQVALLAVIASFVVTIGAGGSGTPGLLVVDGRDPAKRWPTERPRCFVS